MPRARTKKAAAEQPHDATDGTGTTAAERKDTDHFGDRQFPYLNTPAVLNGVIIDVQNMDVPRPMSEHDLAEVLEVQQEQARQFRTAQGHKRDLLIREEELIEELAKTRKGIRSVEALLIDLGDRMATVAEEVGSKERITATKVTLCVTPQNEVVYQDAETGKEVKERTTATPAQLDKARQPPLEFRKEVPHKGVRDDLVVVSVDTALFDRSIEAERKRVVDGPLCGHKDDASGQLVESWGLEWKQRKKNIGGEKGRLYALVPKSILPVLLEHAGKMDPREHADLTPDGIAEPPPAAESPETVH